MKPKTKKDAPQSVSIWMAGKDAELYQLLKDAATASGQTVSEFLAVAGGEKAREVLKNAKRRRPCPKCKGTGAVAT
jgi:uncharacterized protein (DUF1778 family)